MLLLKSCFKLLARLLVLVLLIGTNTNSWAQINTAANRTQLYVPLLRGKNIALVVNQTAVIGKHLTPLPDSLLALGLNIKKIFGPEHGFRGNNSEGASVNDSIDPKTHIPVISLYGKHVKPTDADLKGIDVVVFDIQDVGARFYTFLSTLHYVMEACAQHHIPLIVLDRPNPNGQYVDGPVLDTALQSFVGLHPVPVLYGMTIGEYARMINGQGWLKNHQRCLLKVIPLMNYKHGNPPYTLPIKPSPNLGTAQAISLYPSLCLFEGTCVSVGRGTNTPFEVFGHPLFAGLYNFNFTPQSIKGVSDNPPLKGQTCYGVDLRYYTATQGFNLHWLIEAYQKFQDKPHFFNAYFNKLAGNTVLRQQIESGLTEAQIRQSWQPGLDGFKKIRQQYLLYK